MTARFDCYGDSNHQRLHRYRQLDLLPDWVRQSKDAFPEKQASSLPLRHLADPRGRQFRTDTRAATFLSALFFLDQQNQFPPKTAAWIQQRLEDAVDAWKIRKSYNELRTKLSALQTPEAPTWPDDAFAIVRQSSDGTQERSYPLRNALEVKQAAQWLYEQREVMPFAERHAIATKLLDKAAAYGARLQPLDAFLERQAGRGFCTPAAAGKLIRTHVKAAAHAAPEDVEGMLKLAETAEQTPRLTLDSALLVKLASTLDMFDRCHRLERGYGDYLQRPEDVLFDVRYTEAEAVKKAVCQLTTGSVYEPAQLKKLSVASLRDLFGEDFVDRVTTGAALDTSKLATEVGTLPYPDARTFDSLMEENGLAPVYKVAKCRLPVDAQAWDAAAKSYFSASSAGT